ncbi:GntR family transcriptional regulator [Actinobacteria bacterium YIM 96077]|uniref:HTH gntR-type domain-containing protein n=1 Tax=Phytoactinopolyspora halophila TaxID=1981511 RepID=A0A329R2B5_9ACTN|nr:winged helix-turn-helix domain-containing protein [Phytoactinopolyspora halophila]AYY11972.1 GntR family transcriptional regulator [Actinobacteria bacterium YIM 96077]RAW18794.1 hypothetical protein DPM12_01645 [Phytoactinopolyspora halophila]
MEDPEFDLGETEEPAYLFMRVADHVTMRITTHDLRPGSRLPGERDLASQYGVSIGTVRRATQVLRERGLVRTLPAKGSFIAPISRLRRRPVPGARPDPTSIADDARTGGETERPEGAAEPFDEP